MQGPGTFLDVATYPPGATAQQARIVIDGDRGAVFVYESGNTGPGGTGPLVGSWAGAAGIDPYGNVYPAGLSTTAGNSTIEGTDYIINANGAFFYSGTPALGGLLLSIATAAGTDGFGNAYLAGFWSYPPSGNSKFVGINQGTLYVGNGSALSSMGSVASPASGELLITSPISGDNASTLMFWSSSGSGLGVPVIQVGYPNNGTRVTASDPASGLPETWHPWTPAANWVQSASGPALKYKLSAVDNMACIKGTITCPAAGFTAGAQINNGALPIAYRPSVAQYIPITFITAGLTASTAQTPVLGINTAGNLFADQCSAATAQTFTFQGTYPLDD